MGRTCSTREGQQNANKILVWKPEGKRPLERLSRRWQDAIKTDLKEIGCEDVDCSSGSGQSVVAGSCEHGNERSGFIKDWEFLDQLSDSQPLNNCFMELV
jgi:hypothetical protein